MIEIGPNMTLTIIFIVSAVCGYLVWEWYRK